MVTFSVVIPMYNRAKVIARAIESVLNQTFQDFEIIVVDDGSTDNSVQVVESLTDGRIHLVKQKNSGAGAARNTGIMNTTGKYISFLDSDDTYEPTMLQEQYNVFESDPNVSFLYTAMDLVDAAGNHSPSGLSTKLSGHCYKEALEQGYIASTSVVSARKESFSFSGMFDPTLPASQDDDICFKMAKHFKIACIKTVQANMYDDAGNRISNLRNPANGWWMLWNKYEKDVVDLCGAEVMAKHYFSCVSFFLRADMLNEAKEAFLKYKHFGGAKSFSSIRAAHFTKKAIDYTKRKLVRIFR